MRHTVGRRLRGYVQIIRPELPLAAGMCVVIGQLLALGAAPPPGLAALGFGCGFLLSASAMALNDLFDLGVDRINAPQRPIPSGMVSPCEAAWLGAALALAGLVLAYGLRPLALPVSAAVWLAGLLYNWRLKAAGLWGNLIVALSVAATFVLGGVGVGRPWDGLVWCFALLVFCFDLGEEIAGDAMDAEGDRARGSRSLAIVWGRAAALRVAAALFGLAALVSLAPLACGWLGLAYGIPIAITDALLVIFTAQLLRSRTPAQGRRAMRRLYISGSLGLLAFLLGALLSR